MLIRKPTGKSLVFFQPKYIMLLSEFSFLLDPGISTNFYLFQFCY